MEHHEQETLTMTLKYQQEDWRTHQTKPVTVEFSGHDLPEVYQQMTAHLIKLEMDEQSNIATNVSVVEGEVETPWDSFERQVKAKKV